MFYCRRSPYDRLACCMQRRAHAGLHAPPQNASHVRRCCRAAVAIAIASYSYGCGLQVQRLQSLNEVSKQQDFSRQSGAQLADPR